LKLASAVSKLASFVSVNGVVSQTEDLDFRLVLDLYRGLALEDQHAVRDSISADHSRGLWRLMEIYVDLALAEGDCVRVLDTLTVLALEDFRSDPRENHLRMVLLHWVDGRLGCGLTWRSRLGMFSEDAARRVEGFLAQPTSSLASIGLHAAEADGHVKLLPLEPGKSRVRRP